MKRSIITISLLSLCLVQSPLWTQSLTNADVLRLLEAGLSAEVVIAKIKGSATEFDTSVDALIALQEAEVPQEVLAAMAAGPEPRAAAAPQAQAQEIVVRTGASSAANVATQFEGTPCPSPGIFLEDPGSVREIDPTTYSQTKSGGHFMSAITYGAKSVKSKAVIRGRSAGMRVQDHNPAFLFCFEESEVGLSYETKGATNPSEFLLVALTVNAKKGHRELITGKSTSGKAPRAVLRPSPYAESPTRSSPPVCTG